MNTKHTPARTVDEVFKQMLLEMPFSLEWRTHAYIKEAMRIYAKEQNAELEEVLKGFVNSFYRSDLKFGSQLMVYDKALALIKKKQPMSRYSIPSTTNPAHTIHYGFDRPLQEFFVQVTTTELDESNPGRSADLILMVGTENVLYPDPKNPSKLNYSTNDLIDLIKDYGGVLPENHWLALDFGIEF